MIMGSGGITTPASSVAKPNQTKQTNVPTSTHQQLVWIVSIVVVILLWQVKSIHPILKMLLVLVMLGMVLKFYPNISSQFSKLTL